MHQNRFKWVVWGSVIITLVLWLGSKWYFQDWFVDWEKYPAKAGSLTATILMSWALFLSTRIGFVEKLFGGLDKVYKAHAMVGKWSFFAILLHPLFLFIRYIRNGGMDILSFWAWIEADNSYNLGHNVGLYTFYLMVGLIALTLWFEIPYNIWKKTHEYFGLVISLVLIHVLLVQGDVTNYPLLQWWIYGAISLALACYVYIRWLYYVIGPRYDYVVEDVELCGDTIEIWCKPTNSHMVYNSSQYVYVDFNTMGEYHPFSIASAPRGDGYFKLGIKRLGDYTDRLCSLRPGDCVDVLGPYGTFSEKFLLGDRDCIFIGGGIGITPFMGMWDQALLSEDRGDDGGSEHNWKSPCVDLFYSVNELSEASFYNDISASAIKSQFEGYKNFSTRNHHLYMHDTSKQGYLSAKVIIEKVPDYLDRYIFLCGPKPMTDSIINQFIKLGVKKSRIITEDFNMLPNNRIRLSKVFKKIVT